MTSYPASSSRERLSRISHHFLSDDESYTPPPVSQANIPMETSNKQPEENTQTFVLPILMSLQQEHYFPVYALSQALLAHKTSSAVLLVEGELTSSSCSTVFKPHGSTPTTADQTSLQDLLQQTGYQHEPDVYLIPVAGVTSPYVATSRRLLIPAEASLNGVRSAYLQLKWLASLRQDLDIGLIMLNTDDPAWARRCFDKLATGARMFLDITITSYGYLPDMSSAESISTQLINNQQSLPHEMMGIADILQSDLERHRLTNKEKLQEEVDTSTIGYP
jgi:hypothetical protein